MRARRCSAGAAELRRAGGGRRLGRRRAAARSHAQRPDVLLSDIGMPGEDGYALIRQVRAREARERRLPAAALTAYVRAEDRAAALRAGFDAHVQKPVEPLELAYVVRKLASLG